MTSKILKGPEINYTIHSSLGQFFFDSAETFANRTCQIDSVQDKRESFGSVKLRSVRVALELQKRGITSKDVIVFCSKVTLDNVIPLLASFYLGAKVANLDPLLSVRHSSHLLSLVKPTMIFVEEPSLALIEDSLKNATFQTKIFVLGESEVYTKFSDLVKPQHDEALFRPVQVDIHDTALMFFSSGTTGLPKAIEHSHYSFFHVFYSFYQSDVNAKVLLSFTSFYWISGMFLLCCSFLCGGSRILCPKLEAESTFKIIEKYKVTYIFLAPILTYILTNFERYQDYDTSSVYILMTGGTAMSSDQYLKLNRIFKHTHIIFVYGQTEVGIATIFNPKMHQEFLLKKLGSSGKAAVGFNIKVIDVETNETVGPNQRGEIYIKSPSVMKGYYKVDNPEVFDDEGFLKTGDIGYYDDDECFFIIERLKEMFKYMSWIIVPSAIEAVLLEHPGIKEAVVFGIPRSEEEGEVPAACVILKENCQVSEEEIKEFVAVKVSDYEKLRGGVIFVKELLKTPSGKPMRKTIRNTIINSL